MNEEWRSLDFLGFPTYAVSSLGRIRGPKKIRQPIANWRGYIVVDLYHKGKQKQCVVSRLVALAFIPNPQNLTQVNHRDGQKHNCTVSNLEWVTPKENSEHAVKTGLRPTYGEENPNAHLTQANVDYIKQHPEIPRSVLARQFKVHPTTIYKIRRGQLWNN